MRTQTNTPDTSILTAIIVVLCGCTIIAAAFGAPGSLIAGIVFGLLTGFGAGVWAVGKRTRVWTDAPVPPAQHEPSTPLPPQPQRQQAAQAKWQGATDYQQIRPKVERVDPVSNEW